MTSLGALAARVLVSLISASIGPSAKKCKKRIFCKYYEKLTIRCEMLDVRAKLWSIRGWISAQPLNLGNSNRDYQGIKGVLF